MVSARFQAGVLSVVLSLLAAAKADAQLLTSFIEPGAGRDPITSALGQATQSIDVYVFTLTLPSDDPIVAALAAAVSSGVTVRAILEPCPGEGSSCIPPDAAAVGACQILTQAGAMVKWANPAFIKTHAKTTLIDGTRALVTTINLEPSSFTVRRDYGVYTDDPGIVQELGRVFNQDWQGDDLISDCTQAPSRAPDATVQSYNALVVTPDNARDLLIGSSAVSGLVGTAASTLLIQMEKLDTQMSRGVIPALRDAVRRGVTVQVLVKETTGSLAQANAVIGAGGQALCQRDLHAKLVIADGQRLFLGSQNLTQDSLDFRREIGWITSAPDILASFGGTFASDWAAAAACTR
jgi:phosphatidylserine/phosphatidylglycerophosphate/cardiolipin synthase-like enzyme